MFTSSDEASLKADEAAGYNMGLNLAVVDRVVSKDRIMVNARSNFHCSALNLPLGLYRSGGSSRTASTSVRRSR